MLLYLWQSYGAFGKQDTDFGDCAIFCWRSGHAEQHTLCNVAWTVAFCISCMLWKVASFPTVMICSDLILVASNFMAPDHRSVFSKDNVISTSGFPKLPVPTVPWVLIIPRLSKCNHSLWGRTLGHLFLVTEMKSICNEQESCLFFHYSLDKP